MLEYRLEDGSYYLYDMSQPINGLTGRREVLSMSDDVGLLFDQEGGTLFKHGRPDMVEKEHARMLQANVCGISDRLVMLVGTFPVDELNRCLSHTGYILRFFERLKQGEVRSGKPVVEQASLPSNPSKGIKPGPFVRPLRMV